MCGTPKARSFVTPFASMPLTGKGQQKMGGSTITPVVRHPYFVATEEQV